MLKNAWNSPTITTWGSYLATSLNIVIILPFLLTRFPVEEIALWYLFISIIGLRAIADLGMGVTFSRLVAYAMGGLADITRVKSVDHYLGNFGEGPNWQTMTTICQTMKIIYRWLTLLVGFLVAVGGTLMLLRPISLVDDQPLAWYAWGIVVLTFAFGFYGNQYAAYLQGINEVALFRRWEAIMMFCTIISSLAVLLLGGRLLPLVMVNQGWKVINVLINRYLFLRKTSHCDLNIKQNQGIDREVFNAIWPSAWRSGVGQFMGYGLTQFSGLLYAQVGSAADVASYALGLQFITAISGFSRAPFYSRLPVMGRLYAEGKLKAEVRLARKSMLYAHWIFVVSFIGVGITIPFFLTLIDSNAQFASPLLWALLGLGFFGERYGAMHLQLYSTTNHIVWHIANGVSGAIYICISLALINEIGVLAFPIGLILGQLGFYTWYSARYSYRTFRLAFWNFEKALMIPAFAVLIVYCVIHVFIGVH
jgi:O-antigen/teichoic acid export membrane protein